MVEVEESLQTHSSVGRRHSDVAFQIITPIPSYIDTCASELLLRMRKILVPTLVEVYRRDVR